ncbi:hypothetical protein Tco_0603202 [Tanacetum coccineum]
MAFISSLNTNSGKSEVPTAQSFSTASGQVTTASTEVATATFSHDTICAYIATQQSGSQIKYEDITQIDDDDIKEMDIKWNMALLSNEGLIGSGRRLVRRLPFKGLIAPKSQDRSRRESYKKEPKVEEPRHKAMMAIDGIGWDWSFMAKENEASENQALVAEEAVPTKFALMVMSSSSSDNEVLKASQKSGKDKKGVGFDEYRAVPPLLHKSIHLLCQICLGQVYLNLLMTCTDFSRPPPSIDVQEMKPTVKYAEMYRSQRPRGNQRNWNNQKSHQLGKTYSKSSLNGNGMRPDNAAKPKWLHYNACKRNRFNVLKICIVEVWMPKNRVVDHVSKNISASVN